MTRSVIYWTQLEPGNAASWTFLATEQGICRVLYPGDSPDRWISWLKRLAPGAQLKENREAIDRFGIFELWNDYFNGKRVSFDSVPLNELGTPFQQEVWAQLRQIPYGTVWTYRELAAAIGRPQAVRAVGTANGANPLPILVPCHRVIGSNRTLVGYRGGLAIKEMLLHLEGVESIDSKGHARFQF
ncbi:methylated-DNA--[protein]-cysteine S-methyltransferase [Paenibacillus physcomitrellae]|uniref:Methylated-DNA--protein-cysteine methyltransferase n=1 Tax=Paenibacillus physcomitrellae TaxID=1619311 RepID=A0ABQ1FUH6_9BACL|nr:methylated-DNA--[protein]-cysteine S-methyltransferase [Paenibacillus physcomitrellae]GGA29915.1 methylated-DNA--protein-cysteine methyltransferase [Paenibacillus physcomitrellae]